MLKIFHNIIYFLEKRPVLAWLLSISYAALIFYLSSYSMPPQPQIVVRIPAYFKHIIEYSIFGFLLLASFRSNTITRKNALLIAISVAIFYGISDEFHQFFVPGRVFSLSDISADAIGSFICFFTAPKKSV